MNNSNSPFNCYNFDVTTGTLPDGGFERGGLRVYLADKQSKNRTIIFEKSQELAVRFFAKLIAESFESESESPINANARIAGSMTAELESHDMQGDGAGLVSFIIKHNGKPVPPQLDCSIKTPDMMPMAIKIMQDIAVGSEAMYRMDSVHFATEWYINRARAVQ